MKAIAIATVATLTGLAAMQMPVRAQGTPQIQSPSSIKLVQIDLSWKDAGGVQTAIYNWANHMGMMRSFASGAVVAPGTPLAERDYMATLEYMATGTITVMGQACKLTRYHVEINYQMTGQRTNIACTLPNGQTYEAVEGVGDRWAWNEIGGPGGGLVPGKGSAAPMMDAYNERWIRLWANPVAAVKAAATAGANTKLGMEGGKTTLTYPLPGLPSAIATATLISGPIDGLCTRNCAERIVVRNGADVTEFTLSNYADLNHPEEQLDAFFPGRIVEKKGTTTVRDLTITRTNTPNYYIVVPVPTTMRSVAPPAR